MRTSVLFKRERTEVLTTNPFNCGIFTGDEIISYPLDYHKKTVCSADLSPHYERTNLIGVNLDTIQIVILLRLPNRNASIQILVIGQFSQSRTVAINYV